MTTKSSSNRHRSDRHRRERRSGRENYDDGDSHRRKTKKRSREDATRKRSKKRSRRSSESDASSNKKKRRKDRKRDLGDDDKPRKKKSKSKYKDNKGKGSPFKPNKSALFPMGKPVGSPPEKKIDPDDYFSYHQEFWIYLFREEGVFFNDLDNEESYAAFDRFVEQYNGGKLEEPYYKRNFPNEVIEESKTTKHTWGFKTTQTERKGLGELQKGVRRQTEYSKQGAELRSADINNSISNTTSQKKMLNSKSLPSIQRNQNAEERLLEKRMNRRLKEKVRLTHEELTGGPKDFKERRLEKKREKSDRMHGAHREKEEGAGLEISDVALYGDDKDQASFQSALARERRNRERREQRRNNRIEELKSKEKERQDNMLKMLGLDNLKGGKFEIAPRKDPPPV